MIARSRGKGAIVATWRLFCLFPEPAPVVVASALFPSKLPKLSVCRGGRGNLITSTDRCLLLKLAVGRVFPDFENHALPCLDRLVPHWHFGPLQKEHNNEGFSLSWKQLTAMLWKQKSSINSSDIAGTWKDSKRTVSQRAQDCMEPNSAFHVCTVQTVPKILHIFAPAYLGDTKSTKYTKHICSYLFGKRHLNKIYRSYFLLHVHAVCAKPQTYLF